MKSDVPKQFMLLNGKPLVSYALNAFEEAEPNIEIILVLPPKLRPIDENFLWKYVHKPSVTVVIGGKNRFDSVKNALAHISGEGLVAIHDAARPLISVPLIQKCFSVAEENGCAIPAIPFSESVLALKSNRIKSVSRENLFRCQTPQCFNLSKIKKAYEQMEFENGLTDDASVWQQAGNQLEMVEGEGRNIKVTTQLDLTLVKALVGK